MKSLKVLVTVIALGLVASVPQANAQQKKGGQTPEQQIEAIEQAVGSLSADQKTKITAIMAKNREKMQGVPKEERKEKMAGMMKEQRDEIRAVLTAEQKKKYESMGKGGDGGKKKKDQ